MTLLNRAASCRVEPSGAWVIAHVLHEPDQSGDVLRVAQIHERVRMSVRGFRFGAHPDVLVGYGRLVSQNGAPTKKKGRQKTEMQQQTPYDAERQRASLKSANTKK